MNQQKTSRPSCRDEHFKKKYFDSDEIWGSRIDLLSKIYILKENFNSFMKSKQIFELQILKMLIRAWGIQKIKQSLVVVVQWNLSKVDAQT